MARQALTIVGTVVGAYFGQPQLGFVIGSMLGNAVDPVKNYAPRLSDSKVQTARDGIPINWGAGRFRCAGTVFYLQPGPPTEHEHEEGGKGSGPVSVTYTYTRTHAILVCRGPVLGIRRIWRDQKLVFDASEEPTEAYSGHSLPDLVKAWKAGLAASSNFASKLSIYLGDNDQLPDPDLEALFGVGEVYAHRGYCYVVFKDDDVTARGGSLSNYEFEVVKAGTISHYSVPSDLVEANTAWYAFEGSPIASNDPTNPIANFGQYFGGNAVHTYSAGQIGQQALLTHAAYTGFPMLGYTIGTAAACGFIGTVDASTTLKQLVGFFRNDPPSSSGFFCLEFQSYGSGSATVRIKYYDANGAIQAYVPTSPIAIASRARYILAYDPATFTASLWIDGVLRQTATATEHPIGMSWLSSQAVPPSGLGFDPMPLCKVDEWCVFLGLTLTAAHVAYLNNGNAWRSYAQFLDGSGSSGTGGNVPGAPGWVVDGDGNYYPVSADVSLISPDAVSLAGFLEEICAMSNLEVNLVDTSQILDLIEGIVISRETDGATLLALLGLSFFHDAAEIDGKIRFVPRGGDPALTITIDDLVQMEGPPVVETRDQEIERPRKINLQYYDPALFYIPTKQTAERRGATIAAVGERTIELPVVFVRDSAAQTVDKILKIAWIDLLGSDQFGITDALSYLTPTDIVELVYRNRSQRLRIEKVDNEPGKSLIDARQDRLSAYSSTVAGVGDPLEPPYPTPLNATMLIVMNLPPLRAQDNVPGVYVVACGTRGVWPGALVQISFDGKASAVEFVTIKLASVIGETTAPVDDPADSPAEEDISVDVYGSIFSVSDDQIAARENAFALVDADDVSELGQVQNVVDLGAGLYELINPSRGQLETDAIAHPSGTRFAMLSSAYFVPIDLSHAGETLWFRAVTLGTVAEENAWVSFVYQPGDIIFDGGEVTP